MITNIKSYLSITKKQWNGLVILLVILLSAIAIPAFDNIYQAKFKDTTINNNELQNALNSLNRPVIVKRKLFKFNPNNLPVQQWLNLGLTSRQIAVIKHYEERGGCFYSKQDVKKMYSLSVNDYKRLAPYIDLPDHSAYTTKRPLAIHIELNNADSATLTQVYGIGPSFAKRIVKYRSLLGGFHSKQQLREVYGFNEQKYNAIESQVKVDTLLLKKITVNSADANALNRLPYLNYKQANAIVQYRLQHGEYTSVAQLETIMILDKQTINKIKPYLKFK